VLGNTYVLGKV